MQFLTWLKDKIRGLFAEDGVDAASVVILSKSLPVKSIHELQDAIHDLFPGETFRAVTENDAEDDEGDVSFIVDGFTGPTDHPSYFVKSVVPGCRGIFMVHVVPQRYWVDQQVFSDFPDTDPVRAIDDHICWFAIDPLGVIGTKQEGLRFSRLLTAALAPPDTLGMYYRTWSQAMVFSDQVKADLQNGDDPYEKDIERTG